ncbi:MAG TPA: ABC transporter permease, partial [Thermoanaerobaculia bacterium]
SFINPLLLLLIYTFVFAYIMPGRFEDETPTRFASADPYALFLFCGILPWTWFSSSLLESSNVLIAGGNLIKKVMFPAEALPIVVVLSHLVHFALALPILLAALLIAAALGKVLITPLILLAPVLMLIQTAFVVGIALVVSSASVLFRDLRDLVANFLQLGFFLTPIIYLLTEFSSKPLQLALRINPMTPFVLAYQSIFYWGALPPATDIILMCAYALASLATGLTVFDRLRDTLAEAI